MRRLAAVAVLALGCTHGQPPVEGLDATMGGPATGSSEGSPSEDASSSSSGAAQRGPGSGNFVIRGAHLPGAGWVDVLVRDGRIVKHGALTDAEQDGATIVDEAGHYLAPAFIDSHVHLSYAFEPQTLASGGIAAVVDLAAPIDALAESPAPLVWITAGPMITAVLGYPTQSWGAGGYGLEVDGVAEVRAAVDRLVAAGAGVIKVPIGDEPELDDAELTALVDRAHERGRKVVAHALGDADAMRAATAGADVLAHTPVEALTAATIEAWSSRAVISTLDAFGGQPATLANLSRLRAAGTTVLYGTDMGNTGIPAIDHNEIDALVAAGLSGADVVAAATSVPAVYWGFADLGVLGDGARASFLVLEEDPHENPQTLTSPLAVYLDGELQPRSWTAGDGLAPPP